MLPLPESAAGQPGVRPQEKHGPHFPVAGLPTRSLLQRGLDTGFPPWNPSPWQSDCPALPPGLQEGFQQAPAGALKEDTVFTRGEEGGHCRSGKEQPRF